MEVKDVGTADSATADVKVDSSATADVKTDSSTENLPWHKDERFKEFLKEKKQLEAANSKLQKILKDNELEDPDDLEDLVKSGKTIKGKITDLSVIDSLLEKAAKLDSYEEYWAAEAERKRKDTEDPSERAERLEKQLIAERNQKQQELNAKRQIEETKKAIKNYESEVSNLIKEVGLQKDQEPFVLMMFGVNNPSNDVDITDRKAIKKLHADMMKMKDDYDQAVIKSYLDGKKQVVKTGSGAESVTGEKITRMGLKDAHKIAKEQITNMFRGG